MGLPAVRALVVAALALGWLTAARADRPDTPNSNEPFRFDAGDVVESYDSSAGNFRIFYTRSGSNAVPTTDANTNDVPDRVEALAALYEQVAAFYTDKGFRPVLSDVNNAGGHGGDGRFDVYLVDFGKSADGAYRRESCDGEQRCSGFIVQENDFAGYGYPSVEYADRVLASHEYFHAVQAAYDNSETTIFVEGSAVWATEYFDPTLKDFEGFVGGFLDRCDRSLYLPQTGPVDPFSYGAAIFFEFLSERFTPPILEELWTASDGATDWFAALGPILTQHGTSFGDELVTFASWNLYTGKRANPSVAYQRGASYPLVKIEAVTAPLDKPSQRVFPSATTYLGVAPGGRARLAAELVFDAGIDGAPLKLLVALRTGDAIATPVASTDGKTLAVDVGSADEAIFYLVNTATSGESLRPALCLGAPDEVEACAKQYRPATTPMMPSDQGGCRVAGDGELDASLLVVAAVLLVLGARIARRRRTS